MLRNYLIITLRKAIRDFRYTIINISGLALGISSFLFIIGFVNKELDIDNFHSNPERIYRISSDWKWNEFEGQFAGTSPALGTTLIANFDEIDYVTRIRPYEEIRVTVGEDIFVENHTMAVDSFFLEIFDFKIIEGSQTKLFTDKSGIVIPESYALKYFGDESAVGKLLTINQGGNESEFIVSAVIEDAPVEGHINYGILMPLLWDGQVRYMEWSWIWSNLATYVEFKEGFSADDIEDTFPALVLNNAGLAIQRITGNSIEEFFAKGNSIGYFTEPLSDVYYSGGNNLGPVGNKTYIYAFAGVGFLILLLACINYINLTTARSLKRAKEVAIRKVVGSERKQLLAQFIAEAILYSLTATILAVIVGEMLYTVLTNMFELRWDLTPLSSLSSILTFFALSLAVALFAGLYPAFHLTRYQPAKALKGLNTQGENRSLLRNSLVVVQFFISFGIIIMAFTVNSQLDFLQNRKLGFDRDQLLIVNNISFAEKPLIFKNEVLQLSEVQAASLSNTVPGTGGWFEIFKKMENWDDDYSMLLINADQDFLKTYGIGLSQGTNFSELDLDAELPKTLISKQALKEFGFSTEDPRGQRIMGLDNEREMEVSGVFEDIDFSLSSQEIPTIVLRPMRTDVPREIATIDYISIRLDSKDLVSTVAKVEELWNKMDIGVPFSYSFYDDIFDTMFRNELRLSGLLNIFSGISVFIGLLGLIGLISFNTTQMQKSIGIRKVFGASIASILVLLTKDFARLLLIAFVIAIPVANYFMIDWLEAFRYKMNLSVWIFVIPGIIVFLIAMITIWSQSIAAARANPAKTIRVD